MTKITTTVLCHKCDRIMDRLPTRYDNERDFECDKCKQRVTVKIEKL